MTLLKGLLLLSCLTGWQIATIYWVRGLKAHYSSIFLLDDKLLPVLTFWFKVLCWLTKRLKDSLLLRIITGWKLVNLFCHKKQGNMLILRNSKKEVELCSISTGPSPSQGSCFASLDEGKTVVGVCVGNVHKQTWPTDSVLSSVHTLPPPPPPPPPS